MDDTVRFSRGPELRRAPRSLPADIYNRARLLLNRCGSPHLFVPIRSMQYQAVLDAREFIFIDAQGDRCIELAWQKFRPQVRAGLADPVPYECVIYREGTPDLMRRLQGEFGRALMDFEHKHLRGAIASRR